MSSLTHGAFERLQTTADALPMGWQIRAARMASVLRSRVYWPLMKPYTFGAETAVHDGEGIALVRTTYGNRKLWQLPGGGLDGANWKTAEEYVKSGGRPADIDMELFRSTAAAEAHQEVGLDVDPQSLEPIRAVFSEEFGNRNTAGIFGVQVDFNEVSFEPNKREIDAIEIFPLTDIPANSTRHIGSIVAGELLARG